MTTYSGAVEMWGVDLAAVSDEDLTAKLAVLPSITDEQVIQRTFLDNFKKSLKIDAWFGKPAESLVLGQLLEAYSLKTHQGTKEYVAIQLMRPAVGRVMAKSPDGHGWTNNKVELKRGQVIGVSLRGNLHQLLYYVKDRATVSVQCHDWDSSSYTVNVLSDTEPALEAWPLKDIP